MNKVTECMDLMKEIKIKGLKAEIDANLEEKIEFAEILEAVD